jgi:predicted TIM-barrel fold metal-dependent hydrolase
VFEKYAPAKTRRIFRIEPLIKRLLEDSKNYNELVNEFESEAKSAVRKRGFSGFKTVIAYRTGLDISPSDEARARASFRDGMKDRAWFGPKVKPLRDYLVNVTAEIASKSGAFLQIHTGLGDTDILGDRCNPLLLQGFLKQERVLKTPIVLIHGGFPYTKEAAWLCSMFPNLYFELSSPFPPTFLPVLSKARFADVLEIVPTNRIVYGSDAIETPEFHWFSAKLTKQALADALGDLVTEHVMSEDEAYTTADKILDANSRRLLA